MRFGASTEGHLPNVEFRYAFGQKRSLPGQLLQPLSIAIADDGLLDVTDDSDNARVSVFDRAGNLREILGDSASDLVQLDVADLARFVQGDAGSWLGDANFDGEFNFSDLVQIFAAGQYEDTLSGNSNWSDGDWNGDGDFTACDLVFAFAAPDLDAKPRSA